jgi:hypothetical protein
MYQFARFSWALISLTLDLIVGEGQVVKNNRRDFSCSPPCDVRRFIIKLFKRVLFSAFNDNVILFLGERLDGADPAY